MLGPDRNSHTSLASCTLGPTQLLNACWDLVGLTSQYSTAIVLLTDSVLDSVVGLGMRSLRMIVGAFRGLFGA